MSTKVNKEQFIEGIVDKIAARLIGQVNKEREKKNKAIINLKDPKARKMAKKYRDKISKDVDTLLKTQLKYS